MAWQLCAMEKIEDVEVRQAILHDMHDVMFISTKLEEHIDTFKERGRIKILQGFEQHVPSNAWINYFWTYYNQFGMCS
jgi:hypothetical protein